MTFDPRRYPTDWPEIRARILKRAGYECEICGVANHAIGYRERDGSFVYASDYCGDMGLSEEDYRSILKECGKKPVKIVLTIAHLLGADTMTATDDQLRALCQRDHLSLDREHHLAKQRENRQRRKAERAGQAQLPFERIEHGISQSGNPGT